MTLYKIALRNLLKLFALTGLPGLDILVERLHPFLVQNARIMTKAYGDLVFDLDLNDRIQRQIFFELYDRNDIDLMKRLVAPGDVVFDVGGNIGLYSVSLAKIVGPTGKVHVFEPIPENMLAIHRNVRLNNFEDRIVKNAVAVLDCETLLELHVPSNRDNTGWASIVATPLREKTIKVQAISLDTYIQKNNIQKIKLIKMDIEGAELRALQGMPALLNAIDSPMIYFEINPFLLEQQGIDPIDVKQYIIRFGYKLFKLKRRRLVEVSSETAEQTYCNILATKRPIL